jgi:hypothetical protein
VRGGPETRPAQGKPHYALTERNALVSEQPRVQIGHFSTVIVWALYFRPDPNPGKHANLRHHIPGEELPVVIGILAEDDTRSACRNCNRCIHCMNSNNDGDCPGLEAHARVEQQREQERRPEQAIQVARFEMPAYLSLGGRIREAVEQLAARSDEPDAPTKE